VVRGFAKFFGLGNAYLAELRGVLEGLNHANRLNFRVDILYHKSNKCADALVNIGCSLDYGSVLLT
jgi:hypothetical protein